MHRAGRVAVVTDSTSSLPAGLGEQLGVRVVPLHVDLGDRRGRDGIDVGAGDVAAALHGRRRGVATSQPSAAEIGRVFHRIVAEGVTGIVAVHLSGRLSGTVAAADRAAAVVRFGAGSVDIEVVDSESTAMGLGFAVLAAARAAAAGADVPEVAGTARRVAARTHALFSVDTLEFLRRGGRIGAPAALLGTALAIKPILEVADGGLRLVEKVRTSGRAYDRLAELAVVRAGDRPVDVAVHDTGSAAPGDHRLDRLVDRLCSDLPGLRSLHRCAVSAVLTAHTGPATVGVVVSPV